MPVQCLSRHAREDARRTEAYLLCQPTLLGFGCTAAECSAVRYQSVDGTQQREDDGDIPEVARMQCHQQNKPRLAEQRVQENQKE